MNSILAVIIWVGTMLLMLLAGWMTGLAISRMLDKPAALPVFERPKVYQVQYQVTIKEDAVIKWFKQLFKRAQKPVAPAPSSIPRTKGRVTYDLTPEAVEGDWSMKGNDAEVLRAIAAEGPTTAAELEQHTGLGKKAVESSVYRLRRKGLIRSERRET